MTILTLQPNATDGKDTQVRSGDANRCYGTVSSLMASAQYKMLIEFDLSSIPLGSICNSATLYMTQIGSGAASAFTITIYSIAVGNADWVEGVFSNPAQAGHPCWNAKAANGSGGVTTPWAGSAGLSTSGTDYEATPLGTFTGNKSDANGTRYSAALTASRVQGWFGTTNTNYGIMLTTSAANGYFASSDDASAGYRPMIIVDYTLPTSLQYVNSKLATFDNKLVQIPGL